MKKRKGVGAMNGEKYTLQELEKLLTTHLDTADPGDVIGYEFRQLSILEVVITTLESDTNAGIVDTKQLLLPMPETVIEEKPTKAPAKATVKKGSLAEGYTRLLETNERLENSHQSLKEHIQKLKQSREHLSERLNALSDNSEHMKQLTDKMTSIIGDLNAGLKKLNEETNKIQLSEK